MIEFFVTLATSQKLRTNATKDVISDVAMVSLKYVSVKQVLKSIKNWLGLINFFLFSLISTFKTRLLITNNLTQFFPMHPSCTPWKHQKTLRFFDVFRGQIKGAWRTIGLITNTKFVDKGFTMHYNYVETLLSAHRFSHSVFTRRKIIKKVFIMFFWDIMYLTFLKVHNPARAWPQLLQKLPEAVMRCFTEIILRV